METINTSRHSRDPYPIPGQSLYLFTDQNGAKALPFRAADLPNDSLYMGVPPPPPAGDYLHKQRLNFLFSYSAIWPSFIYYTLYWLESSRGATMAFL